LVEEAYEAFPKGPKTVEFIEQHAPQLYVKVHFDRLVSKCGLRLAESDGQEILDRLVETKAAPRRDSVAVSDGDAMLGVTVLRQPFAWKQYDWNHDGVLQTQEIAMMVADLKAEPLGLSQEEWDSALNTDAIEDSQPWVRRRIISLVEDGYRAHFFGDQRSSSSDGSGGITIT